MIRDTRLLGRLRGRSSKNRLLHGLAAMGAASILLLSSCSRGGGDVQASGPSVTVGVTTVVKKSLGRQLTLSSELVPFQEIDVYAKESGYVKKLDVDYGTHVKAGQIMATLEIPELQAQLQEDQAEIKNAANQVTRAQHELGRYQAQYNALHLQYTRLNGVFQSQPGIVAQQEVDDAQGKDLAASSQVDAGQAALEAAQSQMSVARAKLVSRPEPVRLFEDYRAFPGVITERYANLGTLVQAGTGSSTQAMPIVRLLGRRSFPPRDSGSRILRPLHSRRRSGECSRSFFEPYVSRQGRAVFRGRTGRHPYYAHRSGCPESRNE